MCFHGGTSMSYRLACGFDDFVELLIHKGSLFSPDIRGIEVPVLGIDVGEAILSLRVIEWVAFVESMSSRCRLDTLLVLRRVSKLQARIHDLAKPVRASGEGGYGFVVGKGDRWRLRPNATLNGEDCRVGKGVVSDRSDGARRA